jgi:hypothetical protein
MEESIMSNENFLDLDLSKIKIAKLLAKENIGVIVDSSMSTAAFYPEHRILSIPNWLNMPKDVLDLLIGHEVGHALYTPRDAFHQSDVQIPGVPKMIMNIVEDPRIEKLIQREYPGLVYSFIKGYDYLTNEMDFFGIKKRGVNVNELSFLDRLNIHAKTKMAIEFTEEEQELVDATLATETFEDVLEVCKRIVEFLGDNKEEQPEDNEQDSGEGEGEGESGEQQDGQGEQQEQDGDDGEQQEQDGESGEQQEQDGELGKELSEKIKEELSKSFTDEESRNNEEQLCEKVDGLTVSSQVKTMDDFGPMMGYQNIDLVEVKKVAKKISTEFNRKKKGLESRKARQTKTGSLDMKKLTSYKFDDNIFQTKTLLPLGKNHGLVLMVDMSASMGLNLIRMVFKQSLILAEFCKINNIPFVIRGFTSGISEVILLELLSSDMSKTQYKQNQEMMCKMHRFSNQSGTPLNLALLEMIPVMKNFKEKNKIEKLSFMVLTDGMDNSPWSCTYKYNNGKSIYKSRHAFNRRTVEAEIIEHIKKTLNATCISFFVGGTAKGVKNAMGYSAPETKVLNQLKTLGFCEYKSDRGYVTSFVLVERTTSKDEKEMSSELTASQLSKLMVNNTMRNKAQTLFANSFTDMIA